MVGTGVHGSCGAAWGHLYGAGSSCQVHQPTSVLKVSVWPLPAPRRQHASPEPPATAVLLKTQWPSFLTDKGIYTQIGKPWGSSFSAREQIETRNPSILCFPCSRLPGGRDPGKTEPRNEERPAVVLWRCGPSWTPAGSFHRRLDRLPCLAGDSLGCFAMTFPRWVRSRGCRPGTSACSVRSKGAKPGLWASPQGDPFLMAL